MDEKTTNERDIDLYLVGGLSAEEEARFEERLLDDPELLAKVRAAEELQQGLRGVAAAGAVQLVTQTGALAWLGHRAARRWLVVSALVLALIPSLLLWSTLRRHDTRATAAINGLQTRLTEAEESSRRLQDELGQSRAQLEQQSQLIAEANRPHTPLALISLAMVRGEETQIFPVPSLPAGNGSNARLRPGWLLLSIELPPQRYSSYEVILLDDVDNKRWHGKGLQPNLYDTVLISLHSSFLPPGRYHLQLAGEDRNAQPIPLAKHSFNIKAQPETYSEQATPR